MTYIRPAHRLIHKGLLGGEGGSQVTALCFDPPHQIDIEEAYWILSKWLHDEITCPDCKRILELPDEPSRGSILRDNVAVRLSLAFNFIDANYWNREVRKPEEDKINPDPDGKLATGFMEMSQSFDEFMQPITNIMKKHEEIFGWDDLVTEEKDA